MISTITAGKRVSRVVPRASGTVFGEGADGSKTYLFGRLPLLAALYGVLVWPFIWGLTEQMTYNGYLVPRFQVLCRSTSVAIAVVTLHR
jgi:hypothetical protein